MNENLYEEIARLAYEIFEREGRIHGRDLDHWLEAERIVISRYEAQFVAEKGQKESKEEVEEKKTKTRVKSSKTQTEKAKKETEKKTTRSKKKSQ
ncbi:MAG: DUF2934 domain-containing protein [Syntrophorhabdaceae bacterium]|nr:DUF2934 domain-containing protein [Syntrophorhabdaceae bacterium]